MSEPIVPGFYPDPTICRVGEDYYLAHSSFEYFPGAPIWHSRDLVRWHADRAHPDRRSQFRRGDGRPSGGLYAGTLRHHDDRFWYVDHQLSDFVAGQLVVRPSIRPVRGATRCSCPRPSESTLTSPGTSRVSAS